MVFLSQGKREQKVSGETKLSEPRSQKTNLLIKFYTEDFRNSEMQQSCKFNRKGERVQWLQNQYHHLKLYRALALLYKGPYRKSQVSVQGAERILKLTVFYRLPFKQYVNDKGLYGTLAVAVS